MKIKLLIIKIFFVSIVFSQNVGIGTTNPTNKLHVVSSGNPIRLEGLTAFGTEQHLLIVNPTTGVIKHMHIDSLRNKLSISSDTDVDSVSYTNDSLYIYENGKVVTTYISTTIDTSFLDSLIFSKIDSIYGFISDSLTNDSLWLSKIDSDVDSVSYKNDSLYIYENGKVVITYINTTTDTSLVDSLIYTKMDSIYKFVSDSLANDSLWLSKIDSDVDSVKLFGDTMLSIYENGKKIDADVSSLKDSSEWIDGKLLGLGVGKIYARKSLVNGDTIVISQNERIGVGTSSPKAQLDINRNHNRCLVNPQYGFAIELDTIWMGGWSRGLYNIIGGNVRGTFAHYGIAQTPQYSFIAADNTRAGYTNPDLVVLASNGNVGIATITPTQSLDVNGNARFRAVTSGAFANDLSLTSNGTLTTNSSDRRLKENIETLSYGLNEVLKLKPVTFNWKENSSSPKKDIGFIAQEVDKVIPETVFINPNDGYYGVNYTRLIPVLTMAIQEQQEQIKELQKEIENLLLIIKKQ